MTTTNTLARGREAFRHQAWADAYTILSSAKDETALTPPDLELFAQSAYLTGEESECIRIWTEAHHEYLNHDDIRKAAQSAFWIGMILFNRGERAQGSGWIARAGRLIEDYQEDCVESGFLLIPEALQYLRKGKPEVAYKLFSQAVEIGVRFDDLNLITFGRLGSGQALIRQNQIEEGTALFDEVMVAVVTDEISPIVAGIVYCAVIDTCQKIYDLRRAREWTKALSRWCDSQPDLIPYRGQCLVRRAEIMQLHGNWPQAMTEIEQACQLSKTSSPPATGEAFYRQAELHRLQGKFSKAEEAYQQASKWGKNPQPGLALLRLAQGRIEAAKSAIRPVMDEDQDRMSRSIILPAYIEIMLAAEELHSAEESANELSDIATELGASLLHAIALRAEGKILLANAKPGAALKKLRWSWSLLKKIEALYESACTQVLIGLACRELGDEDTAQMEIQTAIQIFKQLGAEPDFANADSLIPTNPPEETHGLTPRELEVLGLVATGKTNKAIANELFISERTVDRHVSNILGKLQVSSRSAATAYAYKHNLV